MKTSRIFYAVVSFVLAIGCRSRPEATPCGYPRQVTIDQSCYTGGGVTVKASDYGATPLGFEWTVYAQKDTAGPARLDDLYQKIRIFAPDTFTVPDSLASNYQQLTIGVAANCDGQLRYAKRYTFNKRRSTTNCTVWSLINR